MSGGQYLTKNNFINCAGIKFSAVEGRLNRDSAELVSRNRAEGSVERSNGGARRGNDHDVGRHIDLPLKVSLIMPLTLMIRVETDFLQHCRLT